MLSTVRKHARTSSSSLAPPHQASNHNHTTSPSSMELGETPRAKRAKVVAASAAAGGGEPRSSEVLPPEMCPAAAAASRRLTVWCKSLVFHGEGYAVFDDADGRMVFRVDNYAGGGGSAISMALMDHAGRVLLTVRRRHRRMLSLVETWEVYKGDADIDASSPDASRGRGITGGEANDGEPPLVVMRATKECTVSVLAAAVATSAGDELYRVSWSRREEWSRIHRSGSLVAEVRRKRGGPEKTTLLGKDVLSLVVQPGMDHTVAMAMLMISNSYR